jgi:hypothetical protein
MRDIPEKGLSPRSAKIDFASPIQFGRCPPGGFFENDPLQDDHP